MMLDGPLMEQIRSSGLVGISIFWGGLVRIDIIKVFDHITHSYASKIIFLNVYLFVLTSTMAGSPRNPFDVLWT